MQTPLLSQMLQHKPGMERAFVRISPDLHRYLARHTRSRLGTIHTCSYLHDVADNHALLVHISDKEEYLTYVHGFLPTLHHGSPLWIIFPKDSNLTRDYLRQKITTQNWAVTRFFSVEESWYVMKCCKTFVQLTFN